MKRILSTTAVLALIAAPTFAQVDAEVGADADVDAQVGTGVDAGAEADATASADVAADTDAGAELSTDTDAGTGTAAGITLTSDALIDADIHDSEGEVVGTVADLVVDADGRLQQVVAEVGGLVGLGAREVALDRSQVDIQAVSEADVRVELAMPRQELETMPEHEG